MFQDAILRNIPLLAVYNCAYCMLLQASEISVFVAYVAGLVTFIAPCHLPLVPAYMSYIAGVSLQETQSAASDPKQAKSLRRLLLATSLAYVAGFVLVFVLFGLTVNLIGAKLQAYRSIMHTIGGLLLIVVGAYIAGLFELRFLGFTKRLQLPMKLTRFAPLNAFIIGVSFGFSWTPCIGPVLAVILFWSSQAASFWHGALLLFFYGIGLGTPFLLISLFLQRGIELLRRHRRSLNILMRVSGIFMMVIGVLLLGNWIYLFSSAFTRFGSLELYLFDIR